MSTLSGDTGEQSSLAKVAGIKTLFLPLALGHCDGYSFVLPELTPTNGPVQIPVPIPRLSFLPCLHCGTDKRDTLIPLRSIVLGFF